MTTAPSVEWGTEARPLEPVTSEREYTSARDPKPKSETRNKPIFPEGAKVEETKDKVCGDFDPLN